MLISVWGRCRLVLVNSIYELFYEVRVDRLIFFFLVLQLAVNLELVVLVDVWHKCAFW